MIFPLIIFLFIIAIYSGLKYISKKITNWEYRHANPKNRISKTKTYKTITRRNELLEYEFPFNPNVEKFNLRLLAKLFDLGFYYLILHLFKNNFISSELILLPYAFTLLFLVNPIFESLIGTTIGKFILRLEVIDDTGKKPSLIISYVKNLLQLGIIITYISSHSTFWEDELFFHNNLTLTYTTKIKDRAKILEQIKN